MDLETFARFHIPALEADEIRFNVQIAVIKRALEKPVPGVCHWTLGAPGHCAMKSPRRPILLADLERTECRELAQTTSDLEYVGVVGSDNTPHWFVEEATALGARFEIPIPQRIHVLRNAPNYPGADGSARKVGVADAELLFEWLTAFREEAVPHDPQPEKADVEEWAASGRFLFWTIKDRPVSVAAISRRLRNAAAIAPVYTPPEHRGKGYAGSVTAVVVEQIFVEGKLAACLYTDLRNPLSNRCYAKIGFKPYCDSWHYLRV